MNENLYNFIFKALKKWHEGKSFNYVQIKPTIYLMVLNVLIFGQSSTFLCGVEPYVRVIAKINLA